MELFLHVNNYYNTVCMYWILLTYTHYSRKFSAGEDGDKGDIIIRPYRPILYSYLHSRSRDVVIRPSPSKTFN